FAYRHFQTEKQIGDSTLGEKLKIAIDLGSAFRTSGNLRSWERNNDPFVRANETLDAAFELMEKLGVRYWSFADRHLAPEAYWMRETGQNLEKITEYAAKKEKDTGIQLLLGRSDLTGHSRYQCGAATNPDPHVFAYAVCQTKQA